MTFAEKLSITLVVLAVGSACAYAAMRYLIGPARTLRIVVACVTIIISTALSIVAAEYVVRLAYRDITTTADNTGYFSAKWKRENPPRVNSLGFREREPARDAAPNTYRIAVVGDSFAYGQGIAEEERFSNLLDAQLNGAGFPFEVLNFGIPGAETREHIDILKTAVLPQKPDFVLLQWFVNDVENSATIRRPLLRRLLPSDTISAALHRNSALYHLVNSKWQQLQMSLVSGSGGPMSYNDYLQENFGDPASEHSLLADELLKRFIELCRGNGIDTGIVLFPQLSNDLGEGYALDFLHQRVLAICREHNIRCLDLRPMLAQQSPAQSLWVNPLDAHPGPLTNRLAAAAILKSFRQDWRKAVPESQ